MKVLDPCCGGKMFYFDKNDPRVLFTDKRKESHILCDRRQLNIDPDLIMDFTNLKFPDGKFKMVVFDPPHMNSLGKKSWMALKYGVLPSDWRILIKNGFSECFRVLENDGFLIFKWSEVDIKVSDVLKLTNYKPIFGHRTMINNRTIWICFMKSNPKGT